MIEFAIVLPMLLLLIFGSIELARLLATLSSISSASRQAARYGSVIGDRDAVTAGSQPYVLDCAGIRAAARRAAILAPLTSIEVAYDHGLDGTGFGHCDSLNSPILDSTSAVMTTGNLRNGDRVVVTVQATYRPLVPLVLIPELPLTFVAARTYFETLIAPTPTLVCPVGAVPGPPNTETTTVRPATNGQVTDNISTDEVIVILRDNKGCVIPSHVITLEQESGPGTSTIATTQGTTDGYGIARFTAKTCVPGTYVYVARDTSVSPNVVIAERATVFFVLGSATAFTSTFTASPIYVLADGVAYSTLSVTIKDGCNNVLAGKDVSISSSRGGTDTIAPASATTNASGLATFTIRSTVIGQSDLSADETTDGLTLVQTASVNFTPGPAVSPPSLITATPDTLEVSDSTNTSTITVQLYDQFNNPADTRSVTLSVSPGGPQPVVLSANPAATDSSGLVTFTVRSTKSGTFTFTATDTTSLPNLALSVNVTFVPGPADPGTSSMSASPNKILANGTSTSTVSVTLRDRFNNGVSGRLVTVTSSRGATDTVNPPANGITDTSGVAAFAVTSNTVGTADFTAAIIGEPAVPTRGPVAIQFVTPGVDASLSTVAASPTSVVADGTSFSTITVTLWNGLGPGAGNQIVGKTVSLVSSRGGTDTITAVNAVTDANGRARFRATSLTLSSGTPSVFTATDTSDAPNITITQTASVTFTLGPAAFPPSTLVVSTTNLPADGSATTTITVTLMDAQSRILVGHRVTLAKFSGPSGTPTITAVSSAPLGSGPASATTDASGVAVFTVRTTIAGDFVFRATDTTSSPSVTNNSPTITFTPGIVDAAVSTVTVSPASVNSNGTTNATVTVTLKDQFGNGVPGKSVTLGHLAGPGLPVISPASATSSSSGVATFTVHSTTQGQDTFQAVGNGLPLNTTVDVTFTVSEVTSTVTISPSPGTRSADGNADFVVTVTLNDGDGAAVANKVVSLSKVSGTGTPTFSPASATTNASGKVTFSVASTTVTTYVLRAVDTTDSININQTVSAQFINTCVLGSAGSNTSPSTVANWTLTNSTGSTYTLDTLTLSWPSGGSGANTQQMLTVNFNATTIWSTGSTSSPFTISSGGWSGGSSARNISDATSITLQLTHNTTGGASAWDGSGSFNLTTTWRVGSFTCSNGPVTVTK